MSRYQPVSNSPSSPTSPTTPRRSLASVRRPSISSSRFGSTSTVHRGRLPDPEEMDAAFDGPEDDDEAGEERGLLGHAPTTPRRGTVPGDYDFDRDYTQPPESPPPFQPYSSHNPAPGNTNGLLSTAPIPRPNPQRHFLGGILPTSFLPRQQTPHVIGATNQGVFANLSARPENEGVRRERDGVEYVPEDEQKDGPPSYQAALRDAAPAYWDTTVVLPSSNSPFGPLSSSISGDEILIDGMPTGNFFGFFWNLIVSVSFQFVGFLLTYVLHTTHSAKYGSRAGLGLTLIQFGLTLRSRAQALETTGLFPTDPTLFPNSTTPAQPLPSLSAEEADEAAAENALKAFWGSDTPWPARISDPDLPPGSPPVILHDAHEAELFASAHNTTLSDMLGLPSAMDVGRANEYFSFLLMSLGWFLVLTSLGGWWRVKRYERGIKRAQRDSEAAQEAARVLREGGEVEVGVNVTPADAAGRGGSGAGSGPGLRIGPTDLRYYTQPILQAWEGARDIQRGFFGMNGRRSGGRGGRGSGHAQVPTEDDAAGEGGDHELLDVQGFGLGSVSTPGGQGEGSEGRSGRGRGLWGI